MSTPSLRRLDLDNASINYNVSRAAAFEEAFKGLALAVQAASNLDNVRDASERLQRALKVRLADIEAEYLRRQTRNAGMSFPDEDGN